MTNLDESINIPLIKLTIKFFSPNDGLISFDQLQCDQIGQFIGLWASF